IWSRRLRVAASRPYHGKPQKQSCSRGGRELGKDAPALGGEDQGHRHPVADYFQQRLDDLPGEQSEESVQERGPERMLRPLPGAEPSQQKESHQAYDPMVRPAQAQAMVVAAAEVPINVHHYHE